MSRRIYSVVAITFATIVALTLTSILRQSSERLIPGYGYFGAKTSRHAINNLEKELSFLHPDIRKCEDIFDDPKKGQNRSEFEHIWSELVKYNQAANKAKLKLIAKNITRRCFGGFSYRYPEEGQIMAKLARLVQLHLLPVLSIFLTVGTYNCS